MNWSIVLTNSSICTISFCFLLFASHFLAAQEQIRVQSSGVSVSRDKTPMQARSEALTDAKRNALLKAGIPERLLVSNLLYEYSDRTRAESYFHGVSSTEISAEILIDSVHSEQRAFDAFGNMVVTLEVEALVYTYGRSRDPDFFFEIEGLKQVYYEDEFIRFSFRPAKDGYLTVFVFNEKESFVLYPFDNSEHEYLSDEKERRFLRGDEVQFPISEVYQPGYSIEMDSEDRDEASLLLFVYTKKHVPWLDEDINLKSVRSWIYNIPMAEREIEYRNVLLKQLN